jgi:type I restriction enzyme R subunit
LHRGNPVLLMSALGHAGSGLFTDAVEPQADLLRRLRLDGNYPRNVLDLFHQLRLAGNAAVHGDHATALACLKMARQLGIWFYRTFVDRNFKAGPSAATASG